MATRYLREADQLSQGGYSYVYGPYRAPVLYVEPGDRIVVETEDAFESKLKSPDLDLWVNFISFASSPRRAFAMPFALEDTTHVFRPADDGGVQTVVADDPADDAQIELIRSHLREEADQFRRGDFSDPATIHGDHMPGLEALSDGADRIDITYSDMPDGGRITYVTDEPELVDALHDWFEAQLSDHGHDATRG
jgi:hypothetical protein